jgi:hypothetical protein
MEARRTLIVLFAPLLPGAAALAQDAAGRPQRLGGEPPVAPAPEPDFLDERVDWHLAEEESYYLRFGGLIADHIDDGTVLGTGESIDFDIGAGATIALGYTFPDDPIAIEIEYTYRDIDAESDSAQFDSGDFSLHTVAANLLIDAPNVVGPIGAYAGIGAGARLTYFKFSSAPSGDGTTLDLDGDGFYWQAMAGLTVSLGPTSQLYGGVRWSDAGTLEDDTVRVETEILSYEIGLRLFF